MRNQKKIRGNRSIHSAVIEACEQRLLMSTYTVNTISDAANAGASLLTLRQAIAQADASTTASTITFSNGVFGPGATHTIMLIQGQLQVSGTTSIVVPQGDNLSIDANHTVRVFQISAGSTVTLQNMTITNGLVATAPGVAAMGGGILNYGNLQLTGDTVSNSNASGGSYTYQTNNYGVGGAGQGGGIYSTGTLGVTNSTITGNLATGGGSYNSYSPTPSTNIAQGGGIDSAGPLTITGSTVSNNTAFGGEAVENTTAGASFGGGVYAAGTTRLSSTAVSNNTAHGGEGEQTNSAQDSGANASGGGLYLAGTSTISMLTFSGNTAEGGDSGGGGGSAGVGSGGAIFASGPVTMSASTINSNFAEGGDGPFDDNGPGGAGEGAGVTATATFNVSSSFISTNTATGGEGQPNSPQAKASGYGGGFYSTSLLNVVSSTISGNIAQGDSSAAPFDAYGGNGGVGQGGGIYFSGMATITSSTLSGNAARGGVGDPPFEGGEQGGIGADGDGGGVFNSNGLLTISNSTLANNSAQGGAGALGGYGGGNGGNGGGAFGGAIDSTGAVEMFDSTISGNTAAGGTGGGIQYGSNGYFPGAPGRAVGAGLVEAGTYAVAENSIISGNQDAGAIEDDVVGSINTGLGGTNISTRNNLVGTGGGLTNGVNGEITGVNDPTLTPLGNYGGPTQTMPPLVNSPAVNAGVNNAIPAGITTDERGVMRIIGASVDIGAVELQLGSVSGIVFNDLNGDGVQQTGEFGIANVTVYADLSNSGVFKSGDPAAVTNSSGNYTIANVPEGAVIIRQIVPTGDRQSYPIGGSGEHVNVTPAGVTGALFADSTTLYISGMVNLNGTGQGGVVVYADLNNDGKFESTENNKTTASDGSFAFLSLTPGTYTFRVVPPTGETFSGNSAITVTLSSGGVDTDVNFTLTAQTTNQLTGTVIGTTGSYNNQGNTAAKAFDGNLATFFDAPTASGSYAGLDFGSAKVITQISYAPRGGWASRMVGGMFQGSNNATFSGAVTLYTITTVPVTGSLTTVAVNNSTAFRYVRYIGPANGYCNIAEAQFFGNSTTSNGAATLGANGQLMVIGTSGANNILLSFNASSGGGLVNVTVNGVLQSFGLSSVKSVVINSGDGNDTINVSGVYQGSADLPPVSVNAGNGSDTFTQTVDEDGSVDNAFAALSITAGNGNDIFTINDSSARVTITAGNGNDVFSTTTVAGESDLYATITAGDGNDSITTGDSGGLGSQYVVFNAGIGNDTVLTTDRDDYTSGTLAGQAYSLISGDEELVGNVYSDSNHDGNYQAGEPLVAGKSVAFNNSDEGTFGTTTDATGRYFLTVPYVNDDLAVTTYGWTKPITLNGSYTNGELVSGVDFALPTALSGTVIGTTGSYQTAGNTAAKAFDGNLSTYFDAPTAGGSYVGLDLGSAQVITSIAYAPRSGWASRMVGGVFQASNTADFSSGVVTLYTVTATPAAGVLTYASVYNTATYRYLRYVGPANSFCNVAEIQFFHQVPPFAVVNNGSLVITGTQGADTISVDFNIDEVQGGFTGFYMVEENGQALSFNPAGISTIVINSLDGNDTITVNGQEQFDQPGPAAVNVAIHSGSGNDTFSLYRQDGQESLGGTGTASVTLTAGDGNDVVGITGGTFAQFTLGNGDDNLTTAATSTLLTSNITMGTGNHFVLAGGGAGGQAVSVTTGLGQNVFSNADPGVQFNADGQDVQYLTCLLTGSVLSTLNSDQSGALATVTLQSAINGTVQTYAQSVPIGGTYTFSMIPSPDAANGFFPEFTLGITPPAGYAVTQPASATYQMSGSLITGYDFHLIPLSNSLTGTPIGTAGSYRNHGTTITNVFDGNLSTYFDSPDASGDWVGLDLGSAKIVTSVEYAPRAGYSTRMIGGMIKVSNTADSLID